MISFLAKGLVFGGTLILIGSLFTTRRLIERLTQGHARNLWCAMTTLIAIFLLGYLGYAWAFWSAHTRLFDLIVPGVFFLVACFVWFTADLSLKNAGDAMRISLLEQESIVDPLTGIFNRRFLERSLNEEIIRAHRYDLPLSVLLIDIDNFKLINDRHGHQAGDHVLTSFANLIKKQLREPDILARYGGEEFMVIATQTTHQSAVDLAERLRTCIESHGFVLPDEQNETLEICLTCSIGVASLGVELDCTEKLIHSADENLYRAKREGRNRVNADEPGKAEESALLVEHICKELGRE